MIAEAFALCVLLNGSPDKAPKDGNATPAEIHRGTDADAMTPLDQSNAKEDVALTQAIRKAVTAEKGLSFSAKNVKIITRSAAVTLRGQVASEDERHTICSLASNAAGVSVVNDQLVVSTKK